MSRAPDHLDGFGGNLDAAFDAAPAAPAPAGWAMVPVEPTEAMVVAGALATHTAGFIEDVYRAMIAVAPAVPADLQETASRIESGEITNGHFSHRNLVMCSKDHYAALVDAPAVQPQAEPVAWRFKLDGDLQWQHTDKWQILPGFGTVEPLFATPQQAQPTGKAPCARQCEATAFQIEIRELKRALEQAQPADHWFGDKVQGADPEKWVQQAQPPAPVWLPIESAPRDNREILLSNGVAVSSGAWFEADRETHNSDGAPNDDYHEAQFLDWGGGMLPEPTHWMPLPPPPGSAPAAPAVQPLSGDVLYALWASENGLEDCKLCRLNDFTKAARFFEQAHGIAAPGGTNHG